MLTLIQFPHSPKGLSLSPFCLKLEAYLRFAKIPYKNHFTVKLSGAPKKKLPYIELDGKKVGDSSFIIEHLSKENPHWNLDSGLTPEETAKSMVIKRTLEDSVAPITGHLRWSDKDGWKEFGPLVFRGAPNLVFKIIGGRMHRAARKRSWDLGVGRYTMDELLSIYRQNLESVQILLGEGPYVHGGTITSIDCAMFGVLAQNFANPVPKVLGEIGKSFPRLEQYYDRMRTMYDGSSVVEAK